MKTKQLWEKFKESDSVGERKEIAGEIKQAVESHYKKKKEIREKWGETGPHLTWAVANVTEDMIWVNFGYGEEAANFKELDGMNWDEFEENVKKDRLKELENELIRTNKRRDFIQSEIKRLSWSAYN